MRNAEMIWNRVYSFAGNLSELISAERPVLEVCLYRLNQGRSFSDFMAAMKLFFDQWKDEGRPFSTAEALPQAIPVIGEERDCLMLVACKSIEEHFTATREEHYKQALRAADETRQIVHRGHLRPLNWDDWKCKSQCLSM